MSPFGLKHKGYNNTQIGSKFNYKTYQGQEFTEDLGLNWHEWKYRFSDPSLGRFISIDPLAEEYFYNSTYAFQENKLGLGIELEGAELLKRLKEGITEFFGGAFDWFTNETTGEVKRQMEIGHTDDDQKIELIEMQGSSDRAKAFNRMSNGMEETVKGSIQAGADVLETTGDTITWLGIVSGQPAIIGFGEGISSMGLIANMTVDLSDNRPLEEILLFDVLPGVVSGELGERAVKATRNAAGEEAVKKGENKVMEYILKGHEKGGEELINKTLEETVPKPIKYEKKDN